MATKFELFDPYIAGVFEKLSDPEKAVCLPIVSGKAAGDLKLIYALFPPEGAHHNNVPARYTFLVEDGVGFQLSLMVRAYIPSESDDFILGFIAHDQWAEMHKESGMDADAHLHWVGVKYNPNIREGKVFLFKEVRDIIEAVIGKDYLERMRAEKRQCPVKS
jgi:hypothetical protein